MKFKTILLVLTLVTISCKKEAKNELTKNVATTTYQIEQGKHCFSTVIEDDVSSTEEKTTTNDSLNINLSVTNNDVSGVYNFISNNEKNSTGHFVGTVSNNIITSIYTYTKNEKEYKEELIFKVEKNQISLLGGEKIKKNEVNIFADKSKGIYMLQIPRINCK